MKINNN